MNNNQENKNRSQFYFLQIALSFTLSLGVSIFLFGIIAGGYLDRYFNTYPYITFIGIIIAIFLSFYRLIKALPPAIYKNTDKANNNEEE